MTTAMLLVELGLRVTIYAEHFWGKTTSNVAGGQWAPSVVKYRARDTQQFTEILEISYRRFKDSIGKGFGVSAVPNYTMESHPAFDTVLKLSPNLIPPPDMLKNLPFKHMNGPGYRYHTLLVEPPIFLKRLEQDLRRANVPFVSRKFLTPAKVFELREDVVINCTGYGAKELWRDNALFPIKGQLALLSPQPKLKYLFGRSGYLFPRMDAVVIGGTFEEGDDTTAVDVPKCRRLVNTLEQVFSGVPGPAIAFQESDIDHPKNLKYLAPEVVDD
jgi:glycine/D-amino acid oxidase-like deaminating enzyme